jgi:2',3'-cyclic-nucleotide 2'-phosphodiesterase (5'-nucleotidase family)
MLRIGSSGAHGILHVSGATYTFDPSRTGGTDLDGDGRITAFETDRLCDVQVGGKPLDPAKTYRVVVSNFLLGGGDHLGPALSGARVAAEGGLLRDAIATWLHERGACIGSEAAPSPRADRIRVGACAP